MTQAENSEREDKGVVLEARQKAGGCQDRVKALPQAAAQGRGQKQSGGAQSDFQWKGWNEDPGSWAAFRLSGRGAVGPVLFFTPQAGLLL